MNCYLIEASDIYADIRGNSSLTIPKATSRNVRLEPIKAQDRSIRNLSKIEKCDAPPIDYVSPRYNPGVRYDFTKSVDAGLDKYSIFTKNQVPLSVGKVAGKNTLSDWDLDGYNIPITDTRYKINNTAESL